jgi:hypothetical protein
MRKPSYSAPFTRGSAGYKNVVIQPQTSDQVESRPAPCLVRIETIEPRLLSLLLRER